MAQQGHTAARSQTEHALVFAAAFQLQAEVGPEAGVLGKVGNAENHALDPEYGRNAGEAGLLGGHGSLRNRLRLLSCPMPLPCGNLSFGNAAIDSLDTWRPATTSIAQGPDYRCGWCMRYSTSISPRSSVEAVSSGTRLPSRTGVVANAAA